jgi:hypothetical protein
VEQKEHEENRIEEAGEGRIEGEWIEEAEEGRIEGRVGGRI